jgi:hypothetical protein
MSVIDTIKEAAGIATTGGATSIAGTVVGALGKVADKIWVDKNVRDTNMALVAKAMIEAESAGELAEYQSEIERAKDIRESGWLSRQVRPVIALTFHFAFWMAAILALAAWGGIDFAKFERLVKMVIFEMPMPWGGTVTTADPITQITTTASVTMKFTVGAMYGIIIFFYFLSKMLKDWLVGKNPNPRAY